MEIKLTLSLPRDSISIPVARRICTKSLGVLGVAPECVADVTLALTEACANVLLHAHADDEYEVSVGVDDELAVVEVADHGGGFDVHEIDLMDEIDQSSEHGRGILLMRALMDDVRFTAVPGPPRGTLVRLVKRLVWDPSAPGRQLGGITPPVNRQRRAGSPPGLDGQSASGQPDAAPLG